MRVDFPTPRPAQIENMEISVLVILILEVLIISLAGPMMLLGHLRERPANMGLPGQGIRDLRKISPEFMKLTKTSKTTETVDSEMEILPF